MNDQDDSREKSESRRSLRIMLGGIFLLLVAGLAVTLLVVRSKTTTYAATSPQGTVQRYVRLLQNQQVDQAFDMTITTHSRNDFHEEYDNWGARSHDVTLVSSHRAGGIATVVVGFAGFDAGPFGASSDSQRITFTVLRNGRRWLIDDPPYLPY